MDKVRAFFDHIKKSRWFKAIWTIVIVVLGICSIVRYRAILADAWNITLTIPIYAILALFVSQLLMYYCNAQLFYRPLSRRPKLKELWRVSMELNFINTSLPYGEAAGFIWIQRLGKTKDERKELRVVFFWRYFLSILTNHLLSLLAILWVVLSGKGMHRIFAIVAAVNAGFVIGCIVLIILSVKRYAFLKRELMTSLMWGMIYSLLEDASFWVIAASLGHPEFLPMILIGTSAADIISSLSPLPAGIGAFEVPMISALAALGVDLPLATSFTLASRALVLILMQTLGFVLALLSSFALGKKSIRESLDDLREEGS